MANTKVLLIDDDINLGNILTVGLRKYGFETEYMTSLYAIEEMVKKYQPNIIVLDVEVGIENGIKVMPKLQLCFSDIPVIFISSHTDVEYVVDAIGNGGMAYLKKPFSTKELIAYIKKYANNHKEKSYELVFGESVLNTSTHILSVAGNEPKRLSEKEYKLLSVLILHINDIVTRKDISSELWPNGYASNESLNNLISRLRNYLRKDASINIKTFFKSGLQLSIQDSIQNAPSKDIL
jgi:DNA-binding response OmpR family regulator